MDSNPRPVRFLLFFLLSMQLGCGQKKLHSSVAVPSAPARVPSELPLVPSVASAHLSANDKGDNEVKLVSVHRSPGIYVMAEENPSNLR